MKITAKIEGADEIEKLLAQAGDKAESAASAALYEEGLGIDANMVPRIPVDTGRLRSTHYVAPPTRNGGEIFVEVGVGTDYAAAVHERTEVGHVVGEAKFLEKAVAARVPGMAGRLAASIARHLDAGTIMIPLASDPPARPANIGRQAPRNRGRKRTRNKRG